MLGWDVLRETNWGRLFHAYGVAEDTPGHLRNLTSELASLRKAALAHLDSAVLHQGTIYSVTPAAVRVIAGVLQEPALREPRARKTFTLTKAITFLGDVGSSLNCIETPDPLPQPSEAELDELILHLRSDDEGEDDEGWGSPLISVLMCQAVLALREMTSDVLNAIAPFVSDETFDVRQEAINAVAEWGAIQPSSAGSEAVAEIIRERLSGAINRDERAGLVLALGKLGRDVSCWLDDQDEAVRACAALFVANERASSILIAALAHPDKVNTWFERRPPFFPEHTRITLLEELIARNVKIEQWLPAAVALIADSEGGLLADYEWGPILEVAFPKEAASFNPGKRPPLPEHLTSDQHSILKVLVANQNLWNPRDGNANLARMKVGLPDIREEVAAYVRDTPVV